MASIVVSAVPTQTGLFQSQIRRPLKQVKGKKMKSASKRRNVFP